MKERTSPLHSAYFIDGIRHAVSPAEMLEAAKRPDGADEAAVRRALAEMREQAAPIADETMDRNPAEGSFPAENIGSYLEKVLKDGQLKTEVPLAFPESYSKWAVAGALTESLWHTGHFTLGDLSLHVSWQWDCDGLGNMAAFYRSVSALTDYIDALDLSIGTYVFKPGNVCTLSVKAALSGNVGKPAEGPVGEGTWPDDRPEELPDGTENAGPHFPKGRKTGMGSRRKCPKTVSGDRSNRVVYIPFDTCGHKLGGSLLSRVTGEPAAGDLQIGDADYFIDCFEVVREMIEDGIILSGRSIEAGGLLPGLRRFLGTGRGMNADFSGLLRSYGETEPVPLLFAEVPGVLVEIKDSDYDYFDAEFVLQDIAYYPLGRPSRNDRAIRFTVGDPSGLAGILQSLLHNQVSEGED